MNENQASKADRELLAKILTGSVKKASIKRSSTLVGIVDFGSDLVNVGGEVITEQEFEKRAAFHRNAMILREVEVKS